MHFSLHWLRHLPFLHGLRSSMSPNLLSKHKNIQIKPISTNRVNFIYLLASEANCLKACKMGLYPVHLQILPPKASSISCWVFEPDSFNAYIFITIPGEQNPHCEPLFFANNSWIGWYPSMGPPMVSMLWIVQPWAENTDTKH